jgi:hypothetical protein
MDIKGPVIVKKGYLELVCFYEDGYLLLFFPIERFVRPYRTFTFPDYGSPLRLGDIVETPEGNRAINGIEIIPHLDLNCLEDKIRNQLRENRMLITSRFVRGYRYTLR